MKKVIAFLRVSTKGQDLEPQRIAVMNEILHDGFNESEVQVVEGKESAIKLREEQRQTLNEMKRIIEENPSITHIYCFAIDRIARRVSVVLSVYEYLKEKKINLVFLNPSKMQIFDKDGNENPLTQLMLMFLSYGAEMEMKIKKERFKAAREQYKQQGRAICKVAYGYTTDSTKHIIIDEEQSQVIRWVYDTYLSGKSLNWIYREGLQLGYWTEVRGISGGASKIQKFLTKRIYVGEPTKNGVLYPPIISRGLQDTVIKRLASNNNASKSVCKHEYKFLCRGLVHDESGKVMTAVNDKKAYKLLAKKGYFISAKILDSIVWNYADTMNDIYSERHDKDKVNRLNKDIATATKKLATVEKMIGNAELKFDKAYNAYVNSNGRISEDRYEKMVAEIEKEIAVYRKEQTQLQQSIIDMNAIKDSVCSVKKDSTVIYGIANGFKVMREIVEHNVNRITTKYIGDYRRSIEIYGNTRVDPETYILYAYGRSHRLYYVEEGNEIEIEIPTLPDI